MDPGLTDIFAAYAAKHLFDEVEEVHIRDGGDLHIPGFAFAPVFSIWTTIEECLNPPVDWHGGRGEWITTEPFSAPESFPFPEGIGPVECVNVEHEEVLLVPRYLTGVQPRHVQVRARQRLHRQAPVPPRDRPGPHRAGAGCGASRCRRATWWPRSCPTRSPWATGWSARGGGDLGHRPQGRQAARGLPLPDGRCGGDAAHTGSQVVGWQTGFNPVIAMELLATGAWSGTGVYAPEAFDPDPYIALLDGYGIHHAQVEMEPGRIGQPEGEPPRLVSPAR